MLIYISQRFCSNKDIHLASNYPFIAFLACVAITFIQNFTEKQIPFVGIGGYNIFIVQVSCYVGSALQSMIFPDLTSSGF